MDYLSAIDKMTLDELNTERERLIEYALSAAYEDSTEEHQNHVARCVVAVSREILRRTDNAASGEPESE